MKTSISDVIQTEKFILRELPAHGRVLFEARLIVESDLRFNTLYHRLLHRLVAFSHRRKIKREIESIHERLFQDPNKLHFKELVLKHFKS